MADPYSEKVTSVTVSYDTLYRRALGGREEPFPVYTFGNGRKQFFDNLQAPGVYGKPYTVNEDGSITHLPDPDLVSTNP